MSDVEHLFMCYQRNTHEKIKYTLKQSYLPKDKDRHYFIIKGSIQEEGIILIDIHGPNTGAPKYIKQLLKDIRQLLIDTN